MVESEGKEMNPQVQVLIEALLLDAMNCPEKLQDVQRSWDEEWTKLFKEIE